MPDVMLLAGVGALFLAVTLGVVGGAGLAQNRGAVVRSLAQVDLATGRVGGLARDPDLVERVLGPAWQRMVRLARRLSPAGVGSRLQHHLDLAGNPPDWPMERVFAVKGLGLVLGGGAGLLLGLSSALHLLLLGGGLAAAGFFLPDVLTWNAGLKRQTVIETTLADALDMLTVSVEAGLSFDAGMAQVSKNTDGPLAGEFFRVLQEMQIGKSRSAAFRAMTERTTVPDLRAFVSSLVQADALGIPVGGVLREQAKEMRLKRRQRAEEKAQKIPIKILFPMIFFIFPALFVVIIGPGAISIVHSFSR